jgi:4-hydroxyphenylpyruvate dioxygenase
MDENPLGLKRVHHLEFWVGNARQAAYFYRRAFGFSQIAYSGLETGKRKRSSYVMRQGTATFVLTAPLTPRSTVGRHVRLHGDGVRDIALEVEDVDAAFHEALKRGAAPSREPEDLSDAHGTVRRAAVRTYGDTVHSLLSLKNYSGPFLPGFARAEVPAEPAGITRVDHIVGNVELGQMNVWADWYSKVFGFKRYITFDDKDVSTEYSALMSIVMAGDADAIKLPINEPAPGRRKSQIQEYLDYYRSPGVQHIALHCSNILETLTKLRANGVEFLRVPKNYYENLAERIGQIREPMDDRRRAARRQNRRRRPAYRPRPCSPSRTPPAAPATACAPADAACGGRG